ncbi:hypothetical protein CLV63_103249 [Murinocardiopsis flavida]|uniref:DivIVA protein n=1 Tax=Murinocardiopsis flavida TaxID=645275 RepID=A0A2P8DQS7_9ACTN|nr:hypothetical protein [Murinocardiopsis flavida]PSK99524.1 hypothetical protein CLV63_103249 [Murinocardiopsis flavida]
MNEHSPEILPNLLRRDAFTTVRKGGYDKDQVDEYVVRNHNQIRDLQERLARAHDELEQLRRDLANAKEQAAVKPEHEQISERMAEILRIAEEEAKDKRSKVGREAEEIRNKAQGDAQKRMKDAEEHAERVIKSARNEAQEMLSTSKTESDQVRNQAKEESERRVADADARAKKINTTADRRLATLTATHNEAVRRLTDMRVTLAELLEAETNSGPLDPGPAPIPEDNAAPAQPGTPAKPAASAPSAGRQARPAQQAPAGTGPQPPQPPQNGTGPQAPQHAGTGPHAAQTGGGPQQGAQAPARGGNAAGPAKGPQPKPAAAKPEQQPKPAAAKPEQPKQGPAKPAPAKGAAPEVDDTTVNLEPGQITAEQARASDTPQQQGRPAPNRPQGFHYNGPAADEDPTIANDPGITGMYQRPESEGPNAAADAADKEKEGVRIIKP